jgi:hypothetical protein
MNGTMLRLTFCRGVNQASYQSLLTLSPVACFGHLVWAQVLLMQLLSFLLYYSKLRMKVVLGIHPTSNPLNIRWRWNFWQERRWRRRKLK